MKALNPFFYSLLYASGALFSCTQSRGVEELPNIIIIFADDMGYGDVSFFNPDPKVKTPSIDYLSENGLAFTNAHASGSICTPSRYGLLTGRYAFRNQAAAGGLSGFELIVFEPDRKTLGSLLGNTGQPTRDHMVHQSSRRVFAIRKNGWKYIDGLGSGGFTAPAIIQPEPDRPQGRLYHLESDPLESENLYLQELPLVKQLKDELQTIIDSGSSQ